MKTAIFIDTAFVIGRLRQYLPKDDYYHAPKMVENIIQLVLKHAQHFDDELYRIYFYDCPPITKKVHKPISRELMDLSKSQEALFRHELRQALNRQPKTQLRLGQLSISQDVWRLKTGVAKSLLWGKKQWYDLTDEDFCLDIHQKGVSMQVGADMMALALKHQVDKMVVMTHDEDLALIANRVRDEGVQLVLDSMQKPISDDLFGSIDELWTTFHPKKRY